MQNLIGDFILSVCIGHFVFSELFLGISFCPEQFAYCLVIMESHS